MSNNNYHLENNYITSNGINSIVQLIPNSLPQLNHLNLCKITYIKDIAINNVGNDGLRILSENLEHIPTLNELLLRNCAYIYIYIYKLTIDTCNIADEGITVFAEHIKFIPHLMKLNLGTKYLCRIIANNQIQTTGMVRLAKKFYLVKFLSDFEISIA